jgi:hypothetical protein
MKTELKRGLFTLGIAAMLGVAGHTAYAGTAGVQQPVVPRPGTFSFADGRGSISGKEQLTCGPASLLARTSPDVGPRGPFYIDLSFGVLPAGERLGDAESVIGSWAVRTGAGPAFDGGVTRGTIAPIKGGGMVYELYGYTNFTGSNCNGISRGAPGADYDTRNPVRIYGACGSNQDIAFELSRTPLVSGPLGPSFDERSILARVTFHGDVACGQTSDRSRVRVTLSRRR